MVDSVHPSGTAAKVSAAVSFVIPSAAEDLWCAPGSRTRVSVPLVHPQNRHPERSASPIYRVTQRLWRGVEGPRRCSSYPPLLEVFQPLSPHRAGSNHQVRITAHLVVGFRWSKSSEQRDEMKIAGVLRLRATSAVSRDKLVRRFAQDDDFVVELTERKPLCGSRDAHAALSSAAWQESGWG